MGKMVKRIISSLVWKYWSFRAWVSGMKGERGYFEGVKFIEESEAEYKKTVMGEEGI